MVSSKPGDRLETDPMRADDLYRLHCDEHLRRSNRVFACNAGLLGPAQNWQGPILSRACNNGERIM
ncbi:hypothetical protein B2M20_03900 [Nitrobacter vulgaris]|uniref:Uncharacterized protein n=1 Tax=Nitrobacter vulgaris TaxID=29421 RepID=A0A1V4I1J0_NITVU|nr:hypothetical protein B2M20_03900 [Nitrobacter vulgaris]